MFKKNVIVLCVLCINYVFAGDLPDSSITPGALNPNVTQETIDQTICVPGWTKTIRPSSWYTNKIKKQQMTDQRLPGEMREYEEDHLISLQLGGHPTDIKNLWPQFWLGEWGAHRKDVIETYLKRLVCNRTITLKEAQDAIAIDWISAYKKYIALKSANR